MDLWSGKSIKISFSVIFIWFGILKPLNVSSAAPLVLKTVDWVPFVSSTTMLQLIGFWEVLIGILFIFDKTVRIAIPLLFLQLVGTFIPLVMLPEITFQKGGIAYLPSMEGQYIIKNLFIISAALVLGGRLKNKQNISI